MKKVIQSIPAWLQVTVYFILLALATVIAGMVPPLNDFIFFFAVAFFTALLFMKAKGDSMKAIGLYPYRRRHWIQFFSGAACGAVMLLITTAATIILTGDSVSLNKVDPVYLVITAVTCLWSAYAQEFVFRGFPYHTLLSQYAGWKVQLSVMIPFGLMHVNSHMDAQTVVMVMLTTGLGSLLFGLAYIKTRNLSLPVGLHFGWNYLQQHLPRVADNNHRGLITIKAAQGEHNNLAIILPYLAVVIIAILCLWYWRPKDNAKLPLSE